MTSPVIQTIAIPAGDTRVENVTVSSDNSDALLSATEVVFAVYQQAFGIPNFPLHAVVHKTLETGVSVDNPAALVVAVQFVETDTLMLPLGNYYHETTLLNGVARTTVNHGILTVTVTDDGA